ETGKQRDLLVGERTDFLPIAGDHPNNIILFEHRNGDDRPNLATAREQGLTEVAIDGWNAFFFPKGTPEPIVRRLNQATSEALDTPSVRERMQDLGTRVSAPEHRSPKYLAKLLRSDIERWADRIKAAGIAGQ